MNLLEGKVILITGASSGIGEATARKLGTLNAKLVLGARRGERLARLAHEIGPNAVWRETDVTRVTDLEALAVLALERFGRIDVLINNAGIMPASILAADKVDDWSRTIDVNIKGVLHGIHAVLNNMLAQGFGHIINISSIAGQVVLPGGAVYCATKSAVRVISEALRQECIGKIRVTTIFPGLVESEIFDSITIPEVRAQAKQLSENAMSPDVIADAIVYALSQPAHVAVNEIVVRPLAQQF